jgi:hypothetical protein
METDKVAASGSRTLTQEELSALLNAAIAAKREQAESVLTSQESVLAPAAAEHDAHWGNTDYGRIIGAGVGLTFLCLGLGILLGGVALILAALR